MTKKLLVFLAFMSASLFLKAQCGPSYGDNANFDSAGNSIGISFTVDAACGGNLNSITISSGFTVFPSSPTNTIGYATVRLYEGNGLAGNVLATLTNVELNSTDTFDFSALAISMNPSSQYTIIISDFTLPTNTGRGFNTPWYPNYTGGSLYRDGVEQPGQHLAFSVSIDNSTLSVDNFETENKRTTIFPNPTVSYIQIKGLVTRENYTIVDMSGKAILNGIVQKDGRINVEKLSQGMYFIQLEKHVLKFVKK